MSNISTVLVSWRFKGLKKEEADLEYLERLVGGPPVLPPVELLLPAENGFSNNIGMRKT
jgi:hypothetical protein